MTAILYCDKCKEKLEKYGELVSEYIKEICDDYLLRREFTYIKINEETPSKRNQQLVKFLEQRGYVVTTELKSGDVVKIRPNGLTCYDGKNGCLCYICFNRKEHYR
jgi:hypothetical protein